MVKFVTKEHGVLILVAIVSAVCLTTIHHLTSDRIEHNQVMKKLRVIHAVMTAQFDNDIYHDVKTIHYTNDLGERLSTRAYRARQSGIPVGAVFMPVPANGYKGVIQLSVGILRDGTVSGVRILSHQETRGLSGAADQDRSNWLDIFNGQSFATTPKEAWGTRDTAGAFDQLSGATITSQAIINAVKNSLQLYLEKQDTLFSD